MRGEGYRMETRILCAIFPTNAIKFSFAVKGLKHQCVII